MTADLTMLKEWADVAQSVSVIFASLVAVYGIDAWRREYIGKRRMELAEEVLALFYQARDAIHAIRNPLGYGGEGESRKPGPNERLEDKEALDKAYVLIERYNKHTEMFSRIHALRYRFMAQIGIEAAKPFEKLNILVNELLLASHKMARLLTRKDWSFRTDEDFKKHHEQMLEVDRIFYEGGEDDPISPRIDELVGEIERTCKSIIESRGTLFSLLNWRLWRRHG